MKGDFSRTTFRPQNHYSGVRLQQGRVQLDAEFNEHVDIEAYRDESLTRDVVGANGVPEEGGGFQLGVGSNLRDVAVAGNEIWAIGEDGTVLKAAPGSQPWALEAVPAGAGNLNALHLVAAGQGWMVGEGAKIYELSSAQAGVWQPRTAPAGVTADLYDVHVVGGNVWAVGAGGTILFWDGTQWLDRKVQGVVANLRGVHFSGNTGWIVGDGGTLLQATAPAGPWQPHTASKLTTTLRAVALPSATSGWAVGDGGAIYAWDNADSKWKRQTTPAGVAATLRDVGFRPNSTQGTIVGDNGTILATTDGTTWNRETAPTEARLRGVEAESSSATLAVGDNVALARTTGWAPTSQPAPVTARNVTISAGDMYVDGLRIENDRAVTYTTQPDQREPLPGLGNASQRNFGFYVQAQQQLLTAIERESLREVALGGPDTATRTRTVWQVKAIELTGGTNCSDLETLLATEAGKLGHARLRARAEPAPLTSSECLVSPNGGYRRLENQLYRVEIHLGSDDPGGPTFKWSRENGSVTAKLEAITRSTTDPTKGSVTVSSVGRDDVLGFAPEHLIEVTDETHALAREPGLLLEVTKVSGNVLEVKGFTGTGQPSLAMFPVNPIVRRWEGHGVPNPGTWFELEDGVQVQFAFVGPQAEAFRAGDYWTIPARTATGMVEWPRTDGVPLFESTRVGPARLAALGVARLTANGWTILHDCRRKFPPLNGFVQMEYVGGDGQEVMPDLSAPSGTYPLARPLEVAVTNGRYPVIGAKVQFTRGSSESGVLTGDSGSGQTVTSTTKSPNGIATCNWALDGTNLSQQVTATLLDDLDQAPPNPIHFNANLSVAAQVAFDGRNCGTLAPEKTVQAALTKLSSLTGLYPLTGTGFDVNPSIQPVTRQVQVIVVNGCGPVDGAKVVFTPAQDSGTVNNQSSFPATTAGGVAMCQWTLHATNPTQELEAVLTQAPGTLHRPDRVRFVANLRLASETAYETDCAPLSTVHNVKDALDGLATLPRLQHLLGDGQHAAVNGRVPLGVVVSTDCGPDTDERQVRFKVVEGNGTLEGLDTNSEIATTNGEARCLLRVGSDKLHRVEARLVRSGSATFEPPVSFAVTRLHAGEIEYDGSKCPPLVKTDNVQDAITGLCHEIGKAEQGLRITDVRLRATGDALRVASKVPVNVLADGIDIVTSGPVHSQFLGEDSPTCRIALDWPAQFIGGNFTILTTMVIRGEVGTQTSPLGIRWQPTAEAADWLKSVSLPEGVENIVTRLTVLGDYIVGVPQQGDVTLSYLDAELFAQLPPQPTRVRDRVLEAVDLAGIDLATRAMVSRDLVLTSELREAIEARDVDHIEAAASHVPEGEIAAVAAIRAQPPPPSPRFPSGNGRAGGYGELWFHVVAAT